MRDIIAARRQVFHLSDRPNLASHLYLQQKAAETIKKTAM
jgi:hypothetical protein